MSFLGKILIVMQLVTAVTFTCFAGAVYTYHISWKAEAERYKQDIQDEKLGRNDEREASKIELSDATKKRDDARDEADRYSAQVTALQTKVAGLESETERLSNELQTQIALSTISSKEVTFRTNETLKQRLANSQLHKRLDTATAKNLNYEQASFQKKVEVDEMLKKYGSLLEEVALRRKIMKAKDLERDLKTFVALQDPPPVVDGVVLDTKNARNGLVELVTISLGSNDGFVKGHRLFVYNSGLEDGSKPRYLGEIELVLIEPNRAVGRIIEKAKNGIIRKGNNVTSRL